MPADAAPLPALLRLVEGGVVRAEHQHEHQRMLGQCRAGAAGGAGDHEPTGEHFGQADLVSPAWSQCTHLSRGAARWRWSRSPARIATSAVGSACV